MTIWFTSDLHFGHSNILKYCANTRPWSTTDEMDEALVNDWNKCVGDNDTVYFVGDMSFHKTSRTGEILEALKGNIVLIEGNHDKNLVKYIKRFKSVHQILDTKIEGQSVVMCHFPLLQWNKMHHGAYHLYGHVHGELLHEMRGKSMDVGWDANNKLVSWEDVTEAMKNKPVLPHGNGK